MKEIGNLSIILKKRDGEELNKNDVDYFITSIKTRKAGDGEIAAFLMASYLQGLNKKETIFLTQAIVESDPNIVRLFRKKGDFYFDKHSSGGVGDIVSLLLIPFLDDFQLKMAKISGGILGSTGGTIDKLESVPGLEICSSWDNVKKYCEMTKAAIIKESDNLLSVEKRIYKLRSSTATADFIPFVVSSIMSKKLKLDSDLIVLDVKAGDGCNIKTMSDAQKFSDLVLAVAKKYKRSIVVVGSNMNQPLGNNIGNYLEMREVMDILKGKKSINRHLQDILVEIISNSVFVKKVTSFQQLSSFDSEIYLNDVKRKVRKRVNELGKNLIFFERFSKFLCFHGASMSLFQSYAKKSKQKVVLYSGKKGYMNLKRAGLLGYLTNELFTLHSPRKDYFAGVILHKRNNDWVGMGEKIMTITWGFSLLPPFTIEKIKKIANNSYEISDDLNKLSEEQIQFVYRHIVK